MKLNLTVHTLQPVFGSYYEAEVLIDSDLKVPSQHPHDNDYLHHWLSYHNRKFPVTALSEQAMTIIVNDEKLLEVNQTFDAHLVEQHLPVKTDHYNIFVCDDLSVFMLLALCKQLESNNLDTSKNMMVIAESPMDWPFHPTPSRILISDLPNHVIAAIPFLEDKGIASRLCHEEHPGCFDGNAQQLISQHLIDSSINLPVNVLMLK